MSGRTAQLTLAALVATSGLLGCGTGTSKGAPPPVSASLSPAPSASASASPAAFSLSFSPNLLNGTLTRAVTHVAAIEATLDRNPPRAINMRVDEPTALSTTRQASFSAGAGGKAVFASMPTSDTLANGSYTGSLPVRMCYDAAPTCNEPVPSSPWQSVYEFVVQDNLAASTVPVAPPLGPAPSPTPTASPSQPLGATAPNVNKSIFLTCLETPWDMTFTPDGAMLYTERGRGLSVRRADGTTGLLFRPADLVEEGQGGMQGVALDPQFASNRTHTCICLLTMARAAVKTTASFG